MPSSPSMRQHIDNVAKSLDNLQLKAAFEILAEANRILGGRKGQWRCEASCNQQGYGGNVPVSERVTGVGYGRTQKEACRNAKRDATQKAERGAYARHCQCTKCEKL